MEQFAKGLLDVSLTAAYMTAAVMVLRLCLKKAPKYLTVILWGLVALRLVVPALPESNLSLIPNAFPVTDSVITEKADTETPPAVTIPPVEDEEDTKEEAAPAPPITDKVEKTNKASPWSTVFWVWASGFCLMLCYTLVSWIRIRLTVRGAKPCGRGIRASASISTPFILGIIRPKIYLPEGLSDEERVYVITHEKAHLKRGDHLWKPLGFLLLSLHWFNPVLWLAYVLLCRDIEIATDERAINDLGEEHKKPYSHALISCSANRALIAACPLAFGEVGVKSRIKRVLSYKRPAFWIIIAAAVALIATSVFFLTNPKAKPSILGTWYGDDIISVGETYRFDEDGSGLYINYNGVETAFSWRIEKDELFIEEKDPKQDESVLDSCYGYAIVEGALELYHRCDCPNTRLIRTKEIYGGDNKLITEAPWVNEDKNVHLSFSERGVVEGNIKSKWVSGFYSVNEGNLRIHLKNETLEYTYAVNIELLVLMTSSESIFLNSDTKVSLEDHPLVGTWYGIDVKNAGKKYAFDKNGEGDWSFRFKYASFSWKDEDGILSFVEVYADNAPYKSHPSGGTSVSDVEYEIKDGILTIDGLRYSKTKPDYGGNKELVYHYGFMEENGRKRYFFHEDGSLEIWTYHTPPYTENDYNEIPYLSEDRIWIANPNSMRMRIISTHGEEQVSYFLSEDELSLGSASLIRFESLFKKDDASRSEGIITTDPDTGVLPFELNGGVLTINGTGTMSVPPDWAVDFKSAHTLIISEGITTIPESAFDGYSGLQSIYFPSSLTRIGDYAFSNCVALRQVTLPPNLTDVRDTVFDGCTSLKKIVLPDNMKSFSVIAFSNYPALAELVISEENERFFTENGVLYSKERIWLQYPAIEGLEMSEDNTTDYWITLEYYPKGKRGAYTVPEYVNAISTRALTVCTGLTAVDFTENTNITIVSEEMFHGCTSLTEIHLSKAIKRIENNPFSGCVSLETLYYHGTLDEWNAVKKMYWRDTNIQSIVCTE